MFKKFALWFVTFGLSFLLAGVFGSQGKAFFAIHLGIDVLNALAMLALFATAGSISGYAFVTDKITAIGVVAVIGAIAIILLATWVITKLFGIDFFIAYQIMTFGQCLLAGNSKKDD